VILQDPIILPCRDSLSAPWKVQRRGLPSRLIR